MPISDYLANIRSLVGHRELCLPGVTAIIRGASNSILFVRNHGDSDWTFPGGLVEPVESPADAVVREIKEELNATLEISSLLGVFSGPDYRVVYPNGDQVVYVTSVFEFHSTSEELSPDGLEIEEAMFVGLDDIDKLATPPWVKDILANVKNECRY